MAQSTGTYDANDMTILEGLAHVRKRPGMYIGGTGLAGLQAHRHAVVGEGQPGELVVAVREPGWATEWRYRQGEVMRRCDEALGGGVVTRVEVQVRRG